MKSTFLHLLTLIALITPSLGYSLDIGEGYESPDEAATYFLGALKSQGGVKNAVRGMNGEPKRENDKIKKAKEQFNISPLEEKLSERFGDEKLVSFRKIGQDVKLGGKMVRLYYDLFFQSSPKKEAVIVVMQPKMTGNYFIMDVDFSDQSSRKEDSR
jgi:hypothetical protein